MLKMSAKEPSTKSKKHSFFSLEDVRTMRYRRQIEETEKELSIIELMMQLGNFYFCGHNLCDILERRFFYRYGQFIGHGFCYETSALMMLALRNNPTARIVKGTFLHRDRPCAHLWVEFWAYRHWWVLDPCEPESFIFLRSSYYEAKRMKIISRCRYLKFWSYSSVRKLYRKLRQPQTSFLFCELSSCFRTDYEDAAELALERIGDPHFLSKCAFLDDPRCGTILIPDLCHPRIVYSRRLINEFMARPQRLRPKNHTLRQARTVYRNVCKALPEPLSTLERNDD